MCPLDQIIHSRGLSFHCYADDTELYLSTTPSTQLPPWSLVNCLHEIKTWMTTNLLKLNSKKTEHVSVAPKELLQKLVIFFFMWMAVPSRTFGDRAFSVAAPTLWNCVPMETHLVPTLDFFKSVLKKHLFTQAFGSQSVVFLSVYFHVKCPYVPWKARYKLKLLLLVLTNETSRF